ncbi:hypothetical protein P171DRAFT_449571 [Karstenula rhodostoma CBS 690.94]|uniref:CFEM domain-containing protein n=1 Tax=Karstenula rhodostoma CBS 690.94 TaxID=1392251 RepID=A0A9P4U4C9_9PLEO|nr:hypothetical protein P171DRAFT_449571 [Karstenula rhodostoma CBS 690.94]
MRSLFVAVFAVATAYASASPASPTPTNKPTPPPASHGDDAAVSVSSVGSCPQNCWNESAVKAKCDPNADDDCLCGPFFDAVTTCVSQTCSIGENLSVLNTLEPLC